jgi:alginate O-acetyltransferase complex protein AlgI
VLFNSVPYFLFLSLIVLVYWRLRFRQQNVLLLAASYFFYGWWDWRFLSLMLISTLVDFFCARIVASTPNPVRRKSLLMLSLILNFGFLGFFKYFNFFIESASVALRAVGVDIPLWVLSIVLPPGISFYTFQAVAYIVDVYFKKLEPADNLIDYALFISFFPHLIAGPIQRPSHLLPQTQKPRSFHAKAFCDGLLLIASGMFRKVVIADNAAILANAAFNGELGWSSGWAMLLGVYAFAWQIYGDFSAYSDFARGSAQLLGFHFMVNFRQPYLAASLQDFWRRWHISLSSWLRDYLYIPLGGSRKGTLRTYFNLLATMLLGGLWHGANWTFVAWGGIHGVGLAVERLITGGGSESAVQSVAARWARRVLVFHVVCLSWIFFRAQSFGDAGRYLAGFGRWTWDTRYASGWAMLSALGLMMFLLDLLQESRGEEYALARSADWKRVGIAVTLVVLAFVFSSSQSNAFIYFQF